MVEAAGFAPSLPHECSLGGVWKLSVAMLKRIKREQPAIYIHCTAKTCISLFGLIFCITMSETKANDFFPLISTTTREFMHENSKRGWERDKVLIVFSCDFWEISGWDWKIAESHLLLLLSPTLKYQTDVLLFLLFYATSLLIRLVLHLVVRIVSRPPSVHM